MKNTITTPIRYFPLTALILLGISSVWAAKAPINAEDREKQSSHIVSGKIVEITSKVQKSSREGGAGNRDEVFSITVKVKMTSKGKGVEEGDKILVVAWKPHTRVGLAKIGLQGHQTIPKKGQMVTFYLKQKGEAFEPLMPNGIVIRVKAPNQGYPQR